MMFRFEMFRLIFILVFVSWANAAENSQIDDVSHCASPEKSSEIPITTCGSGDGAVDLSYTCVHPANHQSPDLTPVFLLHGLTEDRSTWNGFYEVISLQTNRTVCMLDARNHGLSPRPEKMSFRLMSADLIRLMDSLNVNRAILIGQSMGGKTAAFTALEYPQRVDKLVVEDMRPNTVDPDVILYINTTYMALKRALAFIPELATKEEAVDVVFGMLTEAFQAVDLEAGLKEKTMLQNLIHFVDGRWQYSLDVDIHLQVVNDLNTRKEVDDGVYEGEALFIYGVDSPFKVGEAAEEIRSLFPKALLEGIEGAGHALHQEKPREVLDLVIRFINGH